MHNKEVISNMRATKNSIQPLHSFSFPQEVNQTRK